MLPPVHQRAQRRQDLWAEIRRRRRFQVDDLQLPGRGMRRDSVQVYLRSLERGGYLTSEPVPEDKPVGSRQPRRLYTLVRDTGVEAPRLKPDGTPVTQGRGREQLWRTMRMLRDFDFRSLAIHASTEEHVVPEVEAKDYIKSLAQAGYLKRTQSGGPGRPAQYHLRAGRDTGPRPPQVQRTNAVYDPNLGAVVWTAMGGVQ